MGVWLFIIVIGGPLLGTIFYKLFSGVAAIASGPEPRQEWELPAGRIHMFDGDRYYDSSPDNPYEHPVLDWSTGKIGCTMSDELARHPEYQPAMIGTIEVLKPEHEKGLVAVILDNEKAATLGLGPAGLNSGAQMLVDRGVPKASIRSC